MDRPDFNASESWPFRGGVEEVVIRVSRWGGENLETPEAFQVLVRHRDGTIPMGVSIMANPVAALRRALAESGRLRAGARVSEVFAEMEAAEAAPSDEENTDLDDMLS